MRCSRSTAGHRPQPVHHHPALAAQPLTQLNRKLQQQIFSLPLHKCMLFCNCGKSVFAASRERQCGTVLLVAAAKRGSRVAAAKEETATVQNQHTRQLISARKTVRQTQQQRPESPTVTLTWHACKYKVHVESQRNESARERRIALYKSGQQQHQLHQRYNRSATNNLPPVSSGFCASC